MLTGSCLYANFLHIESTLPSKNYQQNRTNEEDEVPLKSSIISREIISELPRGNGWGVFDHLCHYQGFWCSPSFLEGAMIAHEHFKAQPSDILLCSPQKTGTTWLKALTFAIATRSQYEFSTTPLLTKVPHECIPFLETYPLRTQMKHFPGFPLFQTHLTYSFLPKSVISSKCKIVYVCREPKDVFVSLWYHSRKRRQKSKDPITLEEAFELFCKGINNYGPYWDHALGYWKASFVCPERIMFLRYEELLRDTTQCVKKLAEFMGYAFSQEEENKGTVQQMVEFCSFKNLSNLEVNKSGKHFVEQLGTIENNVFFRKGEEGDWKNHLTDKMAERLGNVTEQKLRDSGFTFDVSHVA